jgi:type IV secretory pathway TrbD component
MAGNHRAGLTKVVVHQSLIRPMMFMGGERTLVILAMLIAGYFAYLLSLRFSILWGAGVGGALWFSLLALLRRMAAADPQMWDVIMRAKKYRAFYPARGRFDAPLPTIKDFK